MINNNEDHFLGRAEDEYSRASRATEESVRDAHFRRAQYYRAVAGERASLLTPSRPSRPKLSIRYK